MGITDIQGIGDFLGQGVVESVVLRKGINPNEIIQRDFKTVADDSCDYSGTYIDGSIIYNNFIGFTVSEINTDDSVVYKGIDIRSTLANHTIYRLVNIVDIGAPEGNIYEADNTLKKYNLTQKISVQEVLDDLTTLLTPLGIFIQYAGGIVGSGNDAMPTISIGESTLLNYVDIIAKILGSNYYISEGNTIIFERSDYEEVYKPMEYVDKYESATYSTKTYNGVTVLGGWDIEEREKGAQYLQPIANELTHNLISGSYFYSSDIADKKNEITQEVKFATSNDLSGFTVNNICGAFGWVQDKQISNDALIAIRPADADLCELLVDTNNIYAKSEKGSLNDVLLSMPVFSVRVRVPAKYKFKTYEKMSNKYIKFPYLQRCEYKNAAFEIYQRESNTNPQTVKILRLINPETNVIITDVSDFLEPVESTGGTFDDGYIDIQPAKVDFQRGIIWVKIADLLTLDSYTLNLDTNRGTMDLQHRVDISISGYGNDPSPYYDSLTLTYKIPDISDIKIRYAIKKDRLKEVRGAGSNVINLPNTIKMPFFNYDGLTNTEVALPGYPVLEQGKDDTNLLKTLADQLYYQSQKKIGTYYLAGIHHSISLGTHPSIQEIIYNYIDQITIIKVSNMLPISYKMLPRQTELKFGYTPNTFITKFIKNMFEYGGGSGVPQGNLMGSAAFKVLFDSAKGLALEGQQNKPQQTNIGGQAGSNTSTTQLQIADNLKGKTEAKTEAYLTPKNSLSVQDTIAAKLNGHDTGVVYATVATSKPPAVPVKADDPDYKDYYCVIGLHQHLNQIVRPPQNSTDNIWIEDYAKDLDFPLLATGKQNQDWDSPAAELSNEFVFSTAMSNITKYQVRNADGTFKENTYYDVNGDEVNVITEPELVKKAPLMFAYIETDEWKGYFPMMCP